MIENAYKQFIPDDIMVDFDLNYVRGCDPLTLDLFRLRDAHYDEKQPVIIWIHGGGWMSGDKFNGVERIFSLVRSGFVGVSINYRLSHVAIFPAQLHDCKAAVRFLRAHADKLNIDPTRIGVWGASAGGHLASLLATTGNKKSMAGNCGWNNYSSAVQACCSWYGPTDLNLMDKFPEDVVPALANMDEQSCEGKLVGGSVARCQRIARLANPILHATKNCPPVLLMHGAKDNYVPLVSSEVFYEALQKKGVRVSLHIIRDGHHNAYMWGSHHISMAHEFFEWYLRKR